MCAGHRCNMITGQACFATMDVLRDNYSVPTSFQELPYMFAAHSLPDNIQDFCLSDIFSFINLSLN